MYGERTDRCVFGEITCVYIVKGLTAGGFTIANPTSAFLRAGPSLVPSPVTATTCRVSKTVLSMIPVRQGEDCV